MARKLDIGAMLEGSVSKLNTMQVREIPLDQLEENPDNSYAQTGIDELAESIEVVGLQQPLVVVPVEDGRFRILAGHRRRSALEKLERKTAPCVVLDADLDPSLRVLILHWTNTMARGGAGLTAENTFAAAKEIKEALLDLKQRGVIELPGKLRTYAKGVSKGGAYEMISDGDIAGTEAVQIIQSYMEQMYSGAMEQQSKTFEGLSSTLEGWNQELQNAMGEGYNEGKKIGMSDQIDWLEGEAGQKMQEVYSEMGTLQSDLENMQQQMYQDIVNGMFSGDVAAGMDEQIAAQVEQMHTRYMEAMATIDSDGSSDQEKIAARAELGALMGEAQAMAESEYYNSEAVSILTDANITMASNIQSSAGSAYQNAGYSLGQQLTKGISSVLSSYVPPSIRVPVVTSSISTSAGTTTGTTTGSHLTGATSPYRAIGENRVPRDNTLYLLHEGERVLTAREARAQDQGGTGGVNIYMGGNYTVRQDSDISAIAEAVAARILRARRIART